MIARPFHRFRRRLNRWMPRREHDLEFVPEGWSRALRDTRIKGWDVAAVPAAQAARLQCWQEAAQGPRPLGSSTATGDLTNDLERHNTLVSFAYTAALAAQGQNTLRLLDWGGGLGQYSWLTEGVLPGIVLEYHCQDVAHQIATGRQYLPRATFYAPDETAPAHYFDLVLASGALQYVQDWQAALAALQAKSRRYLLVTRLPVTLRGESHVVLQRAYRHGYNTEFLGWRLQRDEFLRVAAEQGLVLVREFLIGEAEWARGAPQPAEARGYLFRIPVLDGEAILPS